MSSTTRPKATRRSTSRKSDDLLNDCHPVTRALDKNTQLNQWRHYLFPGLNTSKYNTSIHDVEDAINFYEPPPAIIEKPIPCLSATHAPLQETPCVRDCALKLVKDKFAWNKNAKHWKDIARKALRNYGILEKTENDLKTGRPIKTLPYVLVKLAHFAAKDPDEYFSGIYNWYFGNSIATAIIGGQSCLLFAGGENMSEFCFSFYDRSSASQTVPEVSPKLKISLEEKNPIYDIVPAKDYRSVGIRQRDHCYFFVYDDGDEEITLNKCLKVKTQKYPFVSIDSHMNEFCTVDAGRNIKFWTCDDKYCYRAFALPNTEVKPSDSFAQVKYCSGKDSREFVVADQKKLYRYDKRVGFDSPVSISNPEQWIEMCEQMSLLVPSVVPNYWYVSSNHTCLLYDARFGFVQKWTHMLPQPPAIGSTCVISKETHNPKECLLLGTQGTNHVVAIYNKWKGDVSTPNVLPVDVPVRLDTLHEARLNGVLTDPSITKRFTRCLLGMAPYKKKKRIGVFTLYSTGDVFHQCIFPQKNVSSWNPTEKTQIGEREHELNHLKRWQAEYLNELRRKKSNLTISRLAAFSNLAESIEFRSPEIPRHPGPDLTGPAVWKKSKKVLESYIDFLSPHLLHDFGMDQESEWGSESDGVAYEAVPARSPGPGSIDKVTDWLIRSSVTNMADVVDIDELFVDNNQDVEEKTEDILVSMSSSDDTSSHYSHASRMSYGVLGV